MALVNANRQLAYEGVRQLYDAIVMIGVDSGSRVLAA